LRYHLYIPFGGNRKGPQRTYVNLLTVMVLGGLWHGASWNFAIWGAIHGLALAFERAQGKGSAYRNLPGPLRTAVTFAIVCFAWVFFRAETLPRALAYCAGLLGVGTAQSGAGLLGGEIFQPYYMASLGAAAAVTWLCPQTWDFTRRITAPRAAFAFLVLWTSLIMLNSQSYNTFIYFLF
jgi:alginate O-acetyltransferase complex protein AlgI